jgi:glycosyltransferase involved in cell wall biosynthesis
MKKIGIDFLPVENSPAGIGQYSIGLLKALWEIDKTNKYIVYSTKKIDDEILNNKNIENIVVNWPDKFPLKGIRWMNKVVKLLNKDNVDLFLSFSNNYFALNFPKTIQFVHDLAPLHFPQYYKWNARLLYTSTTKLALGKALQVITISNTIKKELIDLDKNAEKKIQVVNAFMNKNILNNGKVYENISPDTKYILTISTLEPKKNMKLGIQAFSELIKNPQFQDFKYFIIGKKGWHYQELYDELKKLDLEEKVIFLGYVEDCYIADIVARSKCMLLLSMYEGFGMTPLESLYFNNPVVLSNIPVFKEIIGDMGTFVDCDEFDCPKAIARNLSDTIAKGKVDTQQKVTKMYSAEKSAQKLLEIINAY